MSTTTFIFNHSLRVRWPGYIIVILIYVISWLIGKYADPRHRFFVERDPTLSYPFVINTVPSWALIFFAFAIPVFFVLVTLISLNFSVYNQIVDARTRDLHLNLIVLIKVVAVTNLVTNVVKVLVGRLRPDFFAFCDYKGYRTCFETGDFTNYFENTFPGQIGDFKYCNLHINDAHFSFPSGHTSLTFCGMTFIVLFLMHVTAHIRFPNSNFRNVVRFSIVLIPFFTGILVAASRIIDYKHNVEDTVWGALIGISCCTVGYYSNFLHKRPAVWGDKKAFSSDVSLPPSSSSSYVVSREGEGV